LLTGELCSSGDLQSCPHRFNPHPSLLTGEFVGEGQLADAWHGFNPHPSLLTGELLAVAVTGTSAIVFQSTPVIADG